jgi:hypothetical protein
VYPPSAYAKVSDGCSGVASLSSVTIDCWHQRRVKGVYPPSAYAKVSDGCSGVASGAAYAADAE